MAKIKIIPALMIFALAGCATPPPQVRTIIEKPTIIQPANPIPANLLDFKVLVVNKSLLEKMAQSADKNTSYIMLTPDNYEIVVRDFNELKRYIENQKQIIIYYKKATKNGPTDK